MPPRPSDTSDHKSWVSGAGGQQDWSSSTRVPRGPEGQTLIVRHVVHPTLTSELSLGPSYVILNNNRAGERAQWDGALGVIAGPGFDPWHSTNFCAPLGEAKTQKKLCVQSDFRILVFVSLSPLQTLHVVGCSCTTCIPSLRWSFAMLTAVSVGTAGTFVYCSIFFYVPFSLPFPSKKVCTISWEIVVWWFGSCISGSEALFIWWFFRHCIERLPISITFSET